MAWKRTRIGHILTYPGGMILIRHKDKSLLESARRRSEYNIVICDAYGQTVDVVRGFRELSYTKALAEDLAEGEMD